MLATRSNMTLWVPLFLVVLFGSLRVTPPRASASQLTTLESLFDRRSDAPCVVSVAVRSGSSASAPRIIEAFNAHALDTRIVLDWIAFADDVRGFRIYRRGRGDSHFFLLNREGLIPAWLQNYLDLNIEQHSSYQYVLGVVFANGSEILSQPVEATTSSRSLATR